MSHQGRGKHEGYKNKLARYQAQGRKEKNKQKKLRKVAKKQPNNKQVLDLLISLQKEK